MLLGLDGWFIRAVPRRDRRALAQRTLDMVARSAVPLDEPAGNLSLASQQLVVLARALVRRPAVLILDEITAALDFTDREAVFVCMEGLAREGLLLLFITHRMDEVMRLSDRISVLRSGRLVRTLERGEEDPEGLLRLMAPETARTSRMPEGSLRLHAQGIALKRDHTAFDAVVEPGRILGLAGLDGHGQEAFLAMLAGLLPPASGTIMAERSDGRRTPIRQFRQAVADGIAYLPRDRRRTGLFPSLSILDNFALPTAGRDTVFGLIDARCRRARYQTYKDRLSIVAPHPERAITALSGGNQQKVLLARWLALDPRVLLLERSDARRRCGDAPDPLRRVQGSGGRGHGAGRPSSEIEEILVLCDEVLVFRDHALAARLDAGAIRSERVIAAMFGDAA